MDDERPSLMESQEKYSLTEVVHNPRSAEANKEEAKQLLEHLKKTPHETPDTSSHGHKTANHKTSSNIQC